MSAVDRMYAALSEPVPPLVIERLIAETTVERCHRQAFNREQHILATLEGWALRGDDHIKAIARRKVAELLPSSREFGLADFIDSASEPRVFIRAETPAGVIEGRVVPR